MKEIYLSEADIVGYRNVKNALLYEADVRAVVIVPSIERLPTELLYRFGHIHLAGDTCVKNRFYPLCESYRE